MTLKEGAREALKRLGVCESHIEARLQYAKAMAPDSPESTIHPGHEEHYIQRIMETFKNSQTPEGQDELVKRLIKYASKN